MRFIVVCPKVPQNIKQLIAFENVFVVAVDAALKDLVKNHIHVDAAIGDFDSLENPQLLENLPTIKLNPVKDVSDTFSALEYAFSNSEDVVMVGGLFGSRIDHLYANLLLFHHYPKLTIIDEGNKIQSFTEGTYTFEKDEYDYFSIFSIKESLISTKGSKYNLTDYWMKPNDPLGLSNEIEDTLTLTVKQGHVIVIRSKK